MELGETVEQGLRPYWDVDPHSASAEQLDFPVVGDFFFVARGRSVFMGLRAHDPLRVAELIPLVQKIGASLPGTFAVASQSSLFAQGLASGRTIDIEITGPNLSKLVELGTQVLSDVQQNLPSAQARPIPSLDLSSPELHIRPQLIQTAEIGMSSKNLGYVANALIDGAYAGDYQPPRTPPSHYHSGHSSAYIAVGRRNGYDRSKHCAAAGSWRIANRLPHPSGRHGRQVTRYLAGLEIQRLVSTAHHVLVDGGFV